MEVAVDDVVMPGDIVKDLSSAANPGVVVLGPGLRRDADTIFTCKAGVLKKRDPSIYYVDTYQKRYIPNKGENVIGVVTQKSGDIFKVDIGSSEQASLSYLAFEGATKKNRPDVQVGDTIFAKLLVASKHMSPELVCVDSHGKEQRLGILDPNGMLFSCSLNLVRKILHHNCPLFYTLAQNQKYEIAVGMNGKIWIKAPTVKETIGVINIILAAEYTPSDKMLKLCKSIDKLLFMSE